MVLECSRSTIHSHILRIAEGRATGRHSIGEHTVDRIG